MLEWVQSQFLSLLYIIVVIASFVGAVIAGVRFSGGNKVVGWIVGVLALVLLIILLKPLSDALSDKACELNYEKCI
jgi:hypothetical protein